MSFACCARGYEEVDAEGNVVHREGVDPDALCGGSEEIRNLIAFFILGLMNNFGYVVFLSAAADILPKCWPTSIIILVEMVPIIAAQGIAPLFIEKVPYFVRVHFLTITSLGAFYMVAFCESVYLKLAGVGIASVASGFGEITWIALSSYYHKNTVSMFSSGTGGAGIAGSLSYLLLRSVLKLTPRDSLLVVAPLTLLMAISYFFLLSRSKKPSWRGYKFCHNGEFFAQDPQESVGPNTSLLSESGKYLEEPINVIPPSPEIPLSEKFWLQLRLARYTIPLFLVYFAEYLINQGVNPVNRFPQDKSFSGDEYLYYFFLYQIGVFVSRSSVNVVRVRNLWILAGGQCVLLTFFSLVAIYNFIPTIWIMFPIIFIEGLFGGAIYANTFYLASEEIEDRIKEFCLQCIAFWYSIGILSAGLIGIPWQEFLENHRHYKGYGPIDNPCKPKHTPAPTPSLSPSTLAPSPATLAPSVSHAPSPLPPSTHTPSL